MTDPTTIATITKALDKIYNFEYEAAAPYIKELKEKYPRHPVWSFLTAVTFYWQVVPFSTDHPKMPQYRYYLRQTLELCEPMLKSKVTHAEAAFFALSSHASLALVHAVSKENLDAVGEARKSYMYMKEGFVLKKDIVEFYFTSGLYDYYAIQYPETHPVFKPFMIFFEDGDKKRAFEELEYGAAKALFTRTECIYFLGNILLKYEQRPVQSEIWFEKLVKLYPKNLFYQARYAECLTLNGKYESVEPILGVLEKEDRPIFKLIAVIMRGVLAEKHLKDVHQARNAYLKSLQMCTAYKKPGPEFLAYTYLGLARISYKEKNMKKAGEYCKKALDFPEYASLEKVARELLKKTR